MSDVLCDLIAGHEDLLDSKSICVACVGLFLGGAGLYELVHLSVCAGVCACWAMRVRIS